MPKKMFHLKFLPISRQNLFESNLKLLVLNCATPSGEDKTPLKEKQK